MLMSSSDPRSGLEENLQSKRVRQAIEKQKVQRISNKRPIKLSAIILIYVESCRR